MKTFAESFSIDEKGCWGMINNQEYRIFLAKRKDGSDVEMAIHPDYIYSKTLIYGKLWIEGSLNKDKIDNVYIAERINGDFVSLK